MLPAEAGKNNLFAEGCIHLSTDAIHTVQPLEVDIPKGKLTVVTGVSMWIAVLHQVTGAILVATTAASLHRLGRPAA